MTGPASRATSLDVEDKGEEEAAKTDAAHRGAARTAAVRSAVQTLMVETERGVACDSRGRWGESRSRKGG